MAYIYEYIRTRGYEPMHFEEHYARLDALACKYSLAPLNISGEELRNRIAENLRKEGYSSRATNAVCVRIFDGGSAEIECVDMLYNDFSLRALRPQCLLSQVSGELLIDNTSVKRAMLDFNHATAKLYSGDVSIWATEQGEVVAIDGVSVIAVFEEEIRFSERGGGVEFDLVYKAATQLHRRVTMGAIMVEELPYAKELLAVDYRGVTAIASYGEHIYMDITAERLAKQVAKSEVLQIF